MGFPLASGFSAEAVHVADTLVCPLPPEQPPFAVSRPVGFTSEAATSAPPFTAFTLKAKLASAVPSTVSCRATATQRAPAERGACARTERYRAHASPRAEAV